MRVATLALAVAALLAATWSGGVSARDIRTCDNTAFCRRWRVYGGHDVERHQWGLDPISVIPRGGEARVEFQLAKYSPSKEYTEHALLGSVQLLSTGAVRFRVKEPKAVTDVYGERWEAAGDALTMGTIKPAADAKISVTDSDISVCARMQLPGDDVGTTYGVCARVIMQPLSIRVEREGVVAAVINAEGLLGFEQHRERAASDPEEAWKEYFDGWMDTKRMGPAALSLDIAFPKASHLYGLPEHTSPFSLRSTKGGAGAYDAPYRLFNLDVAGHPLDSPRAIYGAVPMVTAVGADNQGEPTAAGAFFLNAAETWVDAYDTPQSAGYGPGRSTHWVAETGVIDVFLLQGPAPDVLSAQYALLTGLPVLPPRYALGYHQCRYSYDDQKDVLAVNAGFDEHSIPYDVIWLDIDHTDGRRYFTWDNKAYPDPIGMQRELAASGRHLVTIVDPHIKVDGSYHVYAGAKERDLFVRDGAGNIFEGECWPGMSSYVDFSLPEARAWWGSLYALSAYNGSTALMGIWNDMNEASVFTGPEATIPKDTTHSRAAVEHRSVHNIYGYWHNSASAEGLKVRNKDVVAAACPHSSKSVSSAVVSAESPAEATQRPFTLTRSFFAGSQRVGAIWTGDNQASWGFLKVATPMLLSLGAAGISFAGADVGGFDGHPDTELLTRWYQAAAFTPFYRGHSANNVPRREPWLFGEPHTSRIRAAIRGRYAHLAYLYTQFRHANTTGRAPMRPLAYEFPFDKAALGVDAAYLAGDAVMVQPVTEPGATTASVYFPLERTRRGATRRTTWFDAESLAACPAPDAAGFATLAAPMERIPVLYRGGRVIPTQRTQRAHSNGMDRDPYTLIAALDADGSARGDLYLDDGASFKVKEGVFLYRAFAAEAIGFNNGTASCRGAARSAAGATGITFTSRMGAPRTILAGLVPPQAAGVTADTEVSSVVLLGLRGRTVAKAVVAVKGQPTYSVTVSVDPDSGAVTVPVGANVAADFDVTLTLA